MRVVMRCIKRRAGSEDTPHLGPARHCSLQAGLGLGLCWSFGGVVWLRGDFGRNYRDFRCNGTELRLPGLPSLLKLPCLPFLD
jgi:hypothetical protein